ncbi:MAG: iron-sulfur cluster assembly scaffold protein [Verrucomicrobia bacterium]|nr:iron-sulfur cluster assembly scaffold protein [Verrucomicrobiota bacterium]
MNDPQSPLSEAIRNPKNIGELADADAIGTVGNSECGEMLRMWIKFKEEKGRRVIDRATFQSFGCETAIAVASLATEMIRGKTAQEALELSSEALSSALGPLPPMKIHCSQLVEGALRSALLPRKTEDPRPSQTTPAAPVSNANLLANFGHDQPKTGGLRIVLLDGESGQNV